MPRVTGTEHKTFFYRKSTFGVSLCLKLLLVTARDTCVPDPRTLEILPWRWYMQECRVLARRQTQADMAHKKQKHRVCLGDSGGMPAPAAAHVLLQQHCLEALLREVTLRS